MEPPQAQTPPAPQVRQTTPQRVPPRHQAPAPMPTAARADPVARGGPAEAQVAADIRGGFGGAGRNNSGAAGSGAAGSGGPGRGAAAPGAPGTQDQLPAGGFQQLALNAQQQEPTDEAAPDAAAGGNDQSALGQAATSDALLMTGTVGRGADVGPAGGEGPPPGGPDLGGPGGPGGQGGNGANAGGVPGFTSGPGGAPGMNLRVAGGQGGGRGGRGGGPGGGRPAPQGVAALWGMQRVMRQRAPIRSTSASTISTAIPLSMRVRTP